MPSQNPLPRGRHHEWLNSSPYQKPIHPSGKTYFPRLYAWCHFFSFKRTNSKSVNPQNRAQINRFMVFLSNRAPSGGRRLHNIRTKDFIGIGYQLKCKTIGLNDPYIWYRLVTMTTISCHCHTQFLQSLHCIQSCEKEGFHKTLCSAVKN